MPFALFGYCDGERRGLRRTPRALVRSLGVGGLFAIAAPSEHMAYHFESKAGLMAMCDFPLCLGRLLGLWVCISVSSVAMAQERAISSIEAILERHNLTLAEASQFSLEMRRETLRESAGSNSLDKWVHHPLADFGERKIAFVSTGEQFVTRILAHRGNQQVYFWDLNRPESPESLPPPGVSSPGGRPSAWRSPLSHYLRELQSPLALCLAFHVNGEVFALKELLQRSPNAQLIGEEVVGEHVCQRLDIAPPRDSQAGWMKLRLFLDPTAGWLVRRAEYDTLISKGRSSKIVTTRQDVVSFFEAGQPMVFPRVAEECRIADGIVKPLSRFTVDTLSNEVDESLLDPANFFLANQLVKVLDRPVGPGVPLQARNDVELIGTDGKVAQTFRETSELAQFEKSNQPVRGKFFLVLGVLASTAVVFILLYRMRQHRSVGAN